MDSPPSSSLPTNDVPGSDEMAPLGAGIDFTDPHSPLAPLYLRGSHLVALLLLGLVFLLYNFVPLWHTDIWGHLKFGRWIVEHRALPAHEPFSPHADHQAPYLNFQWLSQSGLYLVYHLGEQFAGGDSIRRMEGGVEMLHAVHLLLALGCYLALLVAYRRVAGSLPLACVGFVLLLLLDPSLITLFRPQVLGVFLFACLLLALSRPVLSRAALFLVPVLMVLWANLHGSYAVGLVLLGSCLAGRLLAVTANTLRAEGRGKVLVRLRQDAAARRLLLTTVASIAVIGLLNPHGPWLFLYTLQFSRHPNISSLEEWKPLSFTREFGSHWTYLASLFVLIATHLISRRWPTPTAILLIASFGAAPLLQRRMALWWMLLVPWLLLPLWAQWADQPFWKRFHVQTTPSFRKTLLAALFVVIAILWSAPFQWLLHRRPRPLDRSVTSATTWRLAEQLQAGGTEGRWMPPLSRALKRYYPEGRYTGPILASESLGDYLFWALPPEWPMLIYTHLHLFPPDHWAECRTVLFAEPGWQEILDRHQVNLVVVEPESHAGLASALRQSPDWQVVLNETGSPAKRNPSLRLFVALRKKLKFPNRHNR
jgi:hypothetical protein